MSLFLKAEMLSTFEEQFLGLQISHSVFLGPPVTCSRGAFGLVH